MNFKKPKTENLTGALVMGGSAVAGAAASNLLVAELTKKPSADSKKDETKRKLVKGGAVAVALVGLACVDGNDTAATAVRGALSGTAATAVRGALIGMAGAQGISLAREFTEAGKAGKTVQNALGLACPCQERNGLGEPEWFDYSPVYEDSYYTPYEEIVEEKQARNPLTGFTPKETYV